MVRESETETRNESITADEDYGTINLNNLYDTKITIQTIINIKNTKIISICLHLLITSLFTKSPHLSLNTA